ncbi:hypothetical protein [Chania multitudinisentens]|nr:hypothetical protein [Chania multitudinisentens]
MKSSYVKAVHEVYGKGGKVACDETFENYILVLADVVSSTVFIFTILGIINTGILVYLHGLTRGPFAMFIISMVIIICVVMRNGSVRKIKLITTIKLLNLRSKMFIFMITPPWLIKINKTFLLVI